MISLGVFQTFGLIDDEPVMAECSYCGNDWPADWMRKEPQSLTGNRAGLICSGCYSVGGGEERAKPLSGPEIDLVRQGREREIRWP